MRRLIPCSLLAMLAGPAHAALLDQLPGTWAIGTPAACRTAPYAVTLDNGTLVFRDSAGRINVERITSTGADTFTAVTERSPDVARGVRWAYSSGGTDLITVQNLGTGRSFMLVRCGTDLADAAPSAIAAEAVLTRLFDIYRAGGTVDMTNARAMQVFITPELWAAMQRVFRLAQGRGEVPCLNGDPFVDAQEFTITDVRIRIVTAGSGQATARVAFRNAGATKTMRYDIVDTDRGWRIRDIGAYDTPSLLRYLATCR